MNWERAVVSNTLFRYMPMIHHRSIIYAEGVDHAPMPDCHRLVGAQRILHVATRRATRCEAMPQTPAGEDNAPERINSAATLFVACHFDQIIFMRS